MGAASTEDQKRNCLYAIPSTLDMARGGELVGRKVANTIELGVEGNLIDCLVDYSISRLRLQYPLPTPAVTDGMGW